MTRVEDITTAIEQFAPLSYQESYDNAGLVVGHPNMEVKGILLAVDVTQEVLEEALSVGANMVITHHPIIFKGLKRLNSASYVERCVEKAIRNDIALYACHTNLDSAPEGMSWRLARMLGVDNLSVVESTSQFENVGFGVVGEIEKSMDARIFIEFIAKKLNLSMVRHSRLLEKPIRKVAICTGSGGSMIERVRESKADIYITADLRYNDFMEPGDDFTIVDIGHFESEYCAIDILFDILSKKMLNFAVRKSESSCNPVHYKGFNNI